MCGCVWMCVCVYLAMYSTFALPKKRRENKLGWRNFHQVIAIVCSTSIYIALSPLISPGLSSVVPTGLLSHSYDLLKCYSVNLSYLHCVVEILACDQITCHTNIQLIGEGVCYLFA